MPLTPLVYWAQRHEEIYLRVELTDAQNIEVHANEKVLQFRGQGHGAKGQNEYEFSLELLHPVKPEVKHKSTQREVSITVQKQQRGWWSRLTAQERKPVYLAPDFDRWMDESDAEMEIQEKERKKNKKSQKETSNVLPNFKTGFLLVYNLVQFLGFSWMFTNMTVRLFVIGKDSLYDTFHTTGDVMFFCQTLASVEVLNAVLGVVKTGVVPAVLQLFARNFILFIVIGSLEEMHNKPVVFFVFWAWSCIELFRYPFYMLASLNTEWKTLTWLRYTVWMPLYPLGAFSEAVAVVQAIPIFDETKIFSLPLPKAMGSSVSFSCYLYIHLILLCFGLAYNMKHLLNQRRKRYGVKKRKAH